jgi:hypothetical protein
MSLNSNSKCKFLCIAVVCAIVGFVQSSVCAEEWYSPQEKDFRPYYESDKKNKERQAWDGYRRYWWWVNAFYNGHAETFLGVVVLSDPSWTARGKQIVGKIRPDERKQQVQKMLNAVGKDIAKEWAKDNKARKINSTDLENWGERMKKAAERDDGSGEEIKKVILSVQEEVRRRLQ